MIVTDMLNQYVFNLDTFHKFNFFLGTPSGELLRRTLELIFYGIILYMITVEYSKVRKREYKYLIVGFFALFLRQLIMSLVYFSRVFSVEKFTKFRFFIGFIDVYFETLALLLLVSAFIFPAFKNKSFAFQKIILTSFYGITIVTFLSYIIFKVGFVYEGFEIIPLYLMQIVILISPFYMLRRGEVKKIIHRNTILIAFMVYMLKPLITLGGILIFGKLDPRLIIMQHPIPFISILLLMRGVYLTLVDKASLVNQLKKSEENLAHERELNLLKDHFVSVVSHELRTPITSTKLYLELLNQGKFGKLKEKQKDAVFTISNENNRLSDLISDLLIINKIEANKLELDKEKFDLSEIIDKLYLHIAHEKGIKIENKIKKRFYVVGDKKTLKQVFINLINNAIKFSDKGNKIILKCGKKGKKWFLSVRDFGPGIPKEEVPKLFNKFYQVDNSLTRKNAGIGLGLSIVKNIVELHKGNVEVNSSLGKGAEFKICIPY